MSAVTKDTIESLLYEEEGVALDFKQAGYKFISATDPEKAELLKDILAFANAWRRTDAFILIGVQDVKGGRANIIGISEKLDDAAIQQFVNHKTNRPITFSYCHLEMEGKLIAALHIPVQQRPFYLKKDYGSLQKDKVYIRRGSSTAIADLDEIARMGQTATVSLDTVSAEVFFCNPRTQTRIDGPVNIKSMFLDMPPKEEIPNYSSKQPNMLAPISIHQDNSNYFRDLATYTFARHVTKPVYLAVKNTGNVSINNLRIEASIVKGHMNVLVMDEEDFPSVPSIATGIRGLADLTRAPFLADVRVHDIKSKWIAECSIARLHSKDCHWFRHPIYIGATESGPVELDVTIFGSELREPIRHLLSVHIEADSRKVSLSDIRDLERERLKALRERERQTGGK